MVNFRIDSLQGDFGGHIQKFPDVIDGIPRKTEWENTISQGGFNSSSSLLLLVSISSFFSFPHEGIRYTFFLSPYFALDLVVSM